MRRHISMEQLVSDVMKTAHEAVREKSASAVNSSGSLTTEIGRLLTKVAAEIRDTPSDNLTYADVVTVAEARRAKR